MVSSPFSSPIAALASSTGTGATGGKSGSSKSLVTAPAASFEEAEESGPTPPEVVTDGSCGSTSSSAPRRCSSLLSTDDRVRVSNFLRCSALSHRNKFRQVPH